MKKKLTKSERYQDRPDAGVARTRLTRRAWISTAAGGVALFFFGQRRREAPTLHTLGEVTVFKSPSCQCCGKWVERMREHGFTVTQRDMADVTPVKREHGVPAALYSCHTTTAVGYTMEGHVPPDLVEQVIRERPDFAGLAVPGMPQGAPGMELGREPYEVLSFTQSGRTAVYAVR